MAHAVHEHRGDPADLDELREDTGLSRNRVTAAVNLLDRTRVEMARAYAETAGCRRRFLLGYFGEDHPGPCGNCDLCDADRAGRGQEERPAHPAAAACPVGTEGRHEQWGDGMVLSEDQDRITVFFGQAGYRTLALEAVAGQDGLLTVVRRPGGDRWAG